MTRKGTKARSPVQERGIQTKAAIIDAAGKLFAEKGYHGTNSMEIAGKAGVATGTFYSYFDDKKPVFFEVIRGYYRDISGKIIGEGALESLKKPVNNKDGLKNIIHELITALFNAHAFSPELHKEITAMMYSDPDVESLIREEEKKTVMMIRAVLSKVSNRLAVKDVETAAVVVFYSSEEIIHRLRMFNHEQSDERMLQELENMIYKYLFTRLI
jgi:AcrR family transcriptional regulator